jgi:hypothetical protein
MLTEEIDAASYSGGRIADSAWTFTDNNALWRALKDPPTEGSAL